MNNSQFQKTFMDFLSDKNVKLLLFNKKVYVDKKEALSALINSIEETIQAGDINENKAVLDIKNAIRFIEANKLGFALFVNPSKVEIECYRNLSFATTTITCENFGFDIESKNHKDKERFQQFTKMIDFLDVSSGVKPTEIIVNFTVNNVWREQL